MATTLPRIEREIQKTLKRYLRTVPGPKRLWVRVDPGPITFWLLTEPITDKEEERLYHAYALIYERVPDARFDLLVVNPAMFDDPDFHFIPPHGAEEILLD